LWVLVRHTPAVAVVPREVVAADILHNLAVVEVLVPLLVAQNLA
jgi:hypothetical protein